MEVQSDHRWLLLAACIGVGLGVLVYRLMEHWPFDSHCSAGCGRSKRGWNPWRLYRLSGCTHAATADALLEGLTLARAGTVAEGSSSRMTH